MSEVSISEIINSRGVHKNFRPTLERCSELGWAARKLSSGAYNVTSPDGSVMFRVQNNSKTGDWKGAQRVVTRWIAQEHLDAAGIDADLGEVEEIPVMSTEAGNPSTQIVCKTHDKTFTSPDGWAAHVAREHARMDEDTTEHEVEPPEPAGEPEMAFAGDDQADALDDLIDESRQRQYVRGPYRNRVELRGWLARQIWGAMRTVYWNQKEDALSIYAQDLADHIDPDRHDSPAWGDAGESKILDEIRALVGANPALEEELAALNGAVEEREKEVSRLRDTLRTLSELAKEAD